jgi:hypothetical protein
MKTQLLQDFNESGSAPAGPPAHAAGQKAHSAGHKAHSAGQKTPVGGTAAPQPAGTEQARHSAAEPAEPAEPATLRPASAAPEPGAGRPAPAPGPAPVQPRGFAPQPPVFAKSVPLREETTAEWSPDSTGGDPDWLTERLARDTAMHDRSEWSGRWTRHLATWGAAGVLLALLAGGGLWLYEQRQVEGALVVVANTNPAPAESHAGPAPAAPRTPAIAPVSTSAPLPAAAEPAPRMAVTSNSVDGSAGAVAGPSRVAAVNTDTGSVEPAREVQPEAAAPPPKPQRSQARKHPKADTSAAVRDNGPSARQRREETLLQCRAHGYDERQCLQRGCEMTRYGFACKG